jgi:hypothetical protein
MHSMFDTRGGEAVWRLSDIADTFIEELSLPLQHRLELHFRPALMPYLTPDTITVLGAIRDVCDRRLRQEGWQ